MVIQYQLISGEKMSFRNARNIEIYFTTYNAVVLLFCLWTIISYSHMNIYILFYMLTTILIGNMILSHVLRSGRIINVFTTFNGFGLLYTGFYIIKKILLNEVITNNAYYAMMLSYFSILVFDCAYAMTKRRLTFSKKESNLRNSIFINYLLLILLTLSVAVEFYFLFIRIDISSYLAASRAQKSLLTSGASVLTFYTFTIPLVCIISLQQYLKYKDRFAASIAFVSLNVAIVNSIISMSRAELISVLLPVLFLYEHYNRISKRKIILFLVGVILLFGVWKSLFSSGKNFLYYDSEFSTWYEIFSNVFSSNLKPLYGKSYLETLLNLVIPFTNTEPLSVWYVKTFEYDTWLRGGGRGFSAVLEAFMNFDIFGNLLIYSLYGWLLKQAQFNLERDDDKSIIIYMIFLVSMYQFFRSESYSLWKNIMWFRIYPVLILMRASRHTMLRKV